MHSRNAPLLDDADQFIPVPVAHTPARTDSIAFGSDHEWSALWRRTRGGSLHQGGPTAEAGILSDDGLRLLQLEISLGLAERTLPWGASLARATAVGLIVWGTVATAMAVR